jgi:hypothetical protein
MTRDEADTATIHVVVSIYPSIQDVGSERAIRVAASLLGSGDVIRLTTGGFARYTFPPLLMAAPEVVRDISTSRRGVTLQIIDPDGSLAALLPVGGVVAGALEVATVREVDGRLADSFLTRQILDVLPITGVSYDAGGNATVTAAGGDLTDIGSIFGGMAALTAQAFADVDSTDDYARAPRAEGALPPIPIGPADDVIDWYAPAIVVQDMVPGVGATDATPARLLITREPLADLTTSRVVKLVNPRTGSALRTGASYTATPATGVDAIGAEYTYVAGLWAESAGVNAHTVGGSADVTGDGLAKAQPGDLWRVVGDGEEDYRRVTDSTDTTLTLETTYAHTHGTVSGEMVLLTADQADAAFVDMGTLGGIVGPRGGVLSNPMEVAEWMLTRAVMPVGVNVGDLRACASMAEGLHLQTVLRDDGSPLAWVKERIYPILPVVPYVAGGQLRHLWLGSVSASDVVVDLDGVNGLYLISAETVTPEYDAVSLQYRWDIRRQRMTARTTISGNNSLASATPYALTSAEAIRARTQAPDITQGERLRWLEVTSDVVADTGTAAYCLSWLMREKCRPHAVWTFSGSAGLRWLAPGDIVLYSGRICLLTSITGVDGVTIQIRSL